MSTHCFYEYLNAPAQWRHSDRDQQMFKAAPLALCSISNKGEQGVPRSLDHSIARSCCKSRQGWAWCVVCRVWTSSRPRLRHCWSLVSHVQESKSMPVCRSRTVSPPPQGGDAESSVATGKRTSQHGHRRAQILTGKSAESHTEPLLWGCLIFLGGITFRGKAQHRAGCTCRKHPRPTTLNRQQPSYCARGVSG